MHSITSFIKRYPQGVFWGIAFAIPFGGYILNLLYPSDFWQLTLWGIALGGALVTWIADGGTELKTYFSRIVRWRAGIQWYVIGVLTPFAIGFVAFVFTLLLGTQRLADVQFPELSKVIGVYVLSFFFIALGEEPGFRGFSLPRFMTNRSAIAASLIVGVLHAIWHLPLVIGGQLHPIDLLHPLCGSFLLTWIFNKTNGSVFVVMLVHAASDTSAGLFGSLFSGTDSSLFTIWQGAAFVAMAVLVCLFAGKELGRKSEAAMDVMAVEKPAMAR
jgi:membrane protease YdiL (CAAX protease family)